MRNFIHRIFLFYWELMRQNRRWIRTVTGIAIGSLLLGFIVFILYPDVTRTVQQYIEQAFRDITGGGKMELGIKMVWLIFRNNLVAVVLSLFLGIFLGLVPFMSVVINFFILGFLFSIFVFSPEVGANLPIRIFSFLASIVPHAVLEIPAFLIAAAFGLRLGFFWRDKNIIGTASKKFVGALRDNFAILPVLILFLFGAALIEVYVTGNLISWLGL